MPRAIWKGSIHFGPVDVPVKLYSAVGDIAIHSRLLHDQDQVPLEQRMVCPEDNSVVGPEETVKGFEITTDEYVVVEPDELDFMEPEGSRQIDAMTFFAVEEIDDRYLDRTYYLGPDNDDQDYVNLAESLNKSGKAAMCQWVMRKKSYIGVLKFTDGILTLTTHRYASEIVSLENFDLEAVTISDKEMRIARNLVTELEEKFVPENYKDEYQLKLQKLIDQKAKGREVKLPALEAVEETKDDKLLSVLEESLASLKQKQHG